MGTAETPAEPIRGLMGSLLNLFIIFATITPPAVPKAKAQTPISSMPRVLPVRKVSAVAVAPTEMPRNMVTIFISSFWAVLERRSVTPLSRNRLPSISRPISGAAEGSMKDTNMVTMMGNIIFSFWDTGLSCFISIRRSSFVVSAFIIGGCMTGTSAM